MVCTDNFSTDSGIFAALLAPFLYRTKIGAGAARNFDEINRAAMTGHANGLGRDAQ
jgi:hypothetical protein